MLVNCYIYVSPVCYTCKPLKKMGLDVFFPDPKMEQGVFATEKKILKLDGREREGRGRKGAAWEGLAVFAEEQIRQKTNQATANKACR